MSDTFPNPLTMNRRRALGVMSAFSVLGASLLTGCDDSQTAESLTNSVSDSETVSATTTTTSGSCVLIPQETEGPYPLTAVLSNSAMVRKDITEGKGGVPLTLKIKLVDVNNACQPVTQASIYVWHCDKDGVYSGYAQPGTNTVGQTFCRGIQDVDENGEVTFTTIYPGWYSGRITHIHFQVFLFSGSVATATSQIAFPQEVTQAVYNSLLYVAKGQNTSVTSFARDNVFSDGTTYQMATLTGSTSEGYLATLDVGIAV